MKKYLLAFVLVAPAFAEPLVSVNNLNPLTWDLGYNVRIAPLDANGNRIDALETQVLWTGQQQVIQTSIPASVTPYTFTGVWIWYRIYSGTGVAPTPLQWGGFPHKQADKNVPVGVPMNCTYTAPSVMAGDLTCMPGPDTVPPSAPGALNASAAGISAINLAWGIATDNVGVANYGVERCLGAGCTAAFALVGTTVATSYSDSGLASGQTYTYRVRASDAANNFGPYSNLVGVTTPVPAPPPPVGTPPDGTRIDATTGTATIRDAVGVVWGTLPVDPTADPVLGQTGIYRGTPTNRVSRAVNYLIFKGGKICQQDVVSSSNRSLTCECWSGSSWSNSPLSSC